MAKKAVKKVAKKVVKKVVKKVFKTHAQRLKKKKPMHGMMKPIKLRSQAKIIPMEVRKQRNRDILSVLFHHLPRGIPLLLFLLKHTP